MIKLNLLYDYFNLIIIGLSFAAFTKLSAVKDLQFKNGMMKVNICINGLHNYHVF